MKRAYRVVLLVMLLAALPLRGYAGALTATCESHHGGATAVHEHVHGQGGIHHDDSGNGSGLPAHAASVCSICASCCAGASLAPEVRSVVLPRAAGSDRIVFFARRSSGFVPERLDRPPLAS